jgi:hypothetical protein
VGRFSVEFFPAPRRGWPPACPRGICYPWGMASEELIHLELLAEVDALLGQLQTWAGGAPAWRPAEPCRAVVRRVAERADALRVRLEAPLVVATLGGTGTGKSALINALLGSEVVQTGRRRPTTTRPTLICRPDIAPPMLGINPDGIELVQRDLPELAELVLIDCPDPDTTEDTESPGTNLSRLRHLLPHCDVLLVTTTQQKYRSARVADELAAAASGARLVFVQTHADVDQDIRDDWRNVLDRQYATGHVFLVDSPAALADARDGLQPRGELAALVDLLTRQLSGTAAARIRRANFLDLLSEVLLRCGQRIDEHIPAVRQLLSALQRQRTELAAQFAQQMRSELLANRRQWESRILGQIASRWGLSPFALVLRIFQGLGGLLMGTLLWRARTPAQMALWGAVGGVRSWQARRRRKRSDQSADRAVAGGWNQTVLRKAAVILHGYTAEAGLPREAASLQTITAEASRAGAAFVESVSAQLHALVARLAGRHAGWFTRWRYELLLAAMLGLLLYRLGKNFFYDSWWGSGGVYGIDFYLAAAFWLILWCLLLIWALSSRLRGGLRREIDQLAEGWNDPSAAAAVFAQLEDHCREVEQFRQELDSLEQHVAQLRRQLALPDEELGHRR